MGISGFIQTIKSVHEPMHINEYAGKTVAVDGNVWLHKGAFSCSRELALQEETTKYVDYFMRQVSLLQFNKVIPYIVFDGEPLPIKSATVQERRRRRTEALAKGKELLKQGKSQEATECFQQSIHVSPHMIQQVIKALKAKKIQYVVAPYEADAQLTYLMNTKKVDAVITEDSDLLVFGCHTVIFKMNQYGEAIRIQHKHLSTAKEIDLDGWDQTKIRHMCILSGCDYLPSLPGIGLKSAHKLLNKFRTIDSVLRHLRFQGKMKANSDYENHFKRADYAFLYQYVYDPDVKKCITLHTPPAGVQPEKLDYLGDNSNSASSSLLSSSSSSNNNLPSTCDHVKFYSLSNKENIPPWAHFDNKQQSAPSQHKPEASQPSGGLRSVTHVLPLRHEKRTLSLCEQKSNSSITAKELFKVFNHPQKERVTKVIRTHADIASAFEKQRFKNTSSSSSLSSSTPLSSKTNHTPSENHPSPKTTTQSMTLMSKTNTMHMNSPKRNADHQMIPNDKNTRRRTLKQALSNISNNNTTSSTTTFV